MARENAPDVGARERLVDLNGRATRISKDCGDTLAFQGFHDNVSTFSRLVWSKSGRKICLLEWRGTGWYIESIVRDVEGGLFDPIIRIRKRHKRSGYCRWRFGGVEDERRG